MCEQLEDHHSKIYTRLKPHTQWTHQSSSTGTQIQGRMYKNITDIKTEQIHMTWCGANYFNPSKIREMKSLTSTLQPQYYNNYATTLAEKFNYWIPSATR